MLLELIDSAGCARFAADEIDLLEQFGRSSIGIKEVHGKHEIMRNGFLKAYSVHMPLRAVRQDDPVDALVGRIVDRLFDEAVL